MIFKLNPEKIEVIVKVLCVGKEAQHRIDSFSLSDLKILNYFDFESLAITDKYFSISNYINDTDILVIISSNIKSEIKVIDKIFEQLSSIDTLSALYYRH